ncbi:hypothetical protein [Nafulsella turpanensis]|uniref:hypothetical protein n=1 Tax=Nafulsella turpanensis TaxID=1265690 RepID=UPI001F3E6E1D|nr:hypothetical protein [Nafulsella turpanensis]
MKRRFKLSCRKGMLTVFGFLSPALLLAQSVWAPQDPGYYHLLDRYELRQGSFSSTFFTSFKPIGRQAIARFAEEQLASADYDLSRADRFNLQYLLNDNWEWTEAAEVAQKPLLKYFYRASPDFLHVEKEDFQLHVNPVLHLMAGIESESEVRPYLNTRGVELSATIDDRVGIYTFLAENQAVFPVYVRENIRERRAVPGEAFWKNFKENGVDFFSARAYVSVRATEHIGVQFGQDRFFIGNGVRSLVLSDYGNSYPFLKVQTKVWRFNYTNLFAQLRGDAPASTGGSLNQGAPKKFMALHHLSFNITDDFNIGLFEAIISGDSTSNGIELEYLNPVIFYRAVEQYGGSEDNALLGMDAKWNFLRHFQLYGQLVLDEFLLSAYRQNNGWWGNKWALQLGGKYVDVLGLPNLDLQLEWNRVRPFTYAHKTDYTNYTHYSQPLAHPLGANFDEKLAILRYQPAGRWLMTGRLMQADYGRDPAGVNFGGNIFKSYITREQDTGNTIGQGIATKVQRADFVLSYMPAHRLFLELHQTFRQQESALPEEGSSSSITMLGLRWNIAPRDYLF